MKGLVHALCALALTAALSGCMAGMAPMMAGGMHNDQSAVSREETVVYSYDRLMARADALQLTAEQVVALQAVRDSLGARQLDAAGAARASRNVLTPDQRQVAERRDATSPPTMPSHHH